MDVSEESSGNNLSAFSVLKDLTGTSSECAEKNIEQHKLIPIPKNGDRNNITSDVTDLVNDLDINQDEPSESINKLISKRPASNHSKCSQSNSNSITSQELDISNENSDNETNFSYSFDLEHDSITYSKDEMPAWERWFVKKQEQIRRKAEMERIREMKNVREKQCQEALKQKRIEESEANRKLWLEKKKLEEMERRETEGREKESKERERRLKENPAYTFEYWNLQKYQQKKIDILHKDYIKKKEEEEKKKKLKQSEEAVRRWMTKAKHRPVTPRISHAYCGDSAISFYDSTRPPSPTYVNPVPWQDPS